MYGCVNACKSFKRGWYTKLPKFLRFFRGISDLFWSSRSSCVFLTNSRACDMPLGPFRSFVMQKYTSQGLRCVSNRIGSMTHVRGSMTHARGKLVTHKIISIKRVLFYFFLHSSLFFLSLLLGILWTLGFFTSNPNLCKETRIFWGMPTLILH